MTKQNEYLEHLSPDNAAVLFIDYAGGHRRQADLRLGSVGARLDRLAIGVGMIPRGEVGLIFAGMGATLTLAGKPILSPTTFSALVLMIMLTTFITPPLLKMVFERKSSWS